MEANNKVPFIDVIVMTKDLCEYVTGDNYEVISVPIELIVNNSKEKFITVAACKKGEEKKLTTEILKNSNRKKEDFYLDDKYFHITTYESGVKKEYISFDDSDKHSINFNPNEKYYYVEFFFKKFINFRNNLIANNQIVKDDDIYQYFLSLIGFPDRKEKYKKKGTR